MILAIITSGTVIAAIIKMGAQPCFGEDPDDPDDPDEPGDELDGG